MSHLFHKTEFNGDISKWVLNENCDTRFMFDNCLLKKEPAKWPQNYKP